MGNEEALGAAVLAPFTCLSGGMWCFMSLISLVSVFIGIAGLVLWLVMLIDVIKREEDQFDSKQKEQKILWLLVVILAGWIGALIYYLLIYRKFGPVK